MWLLMVCPWLLIQASSRHGGAASARRAVHGPDARDSGVLLPPLHGEVICFPWKHPSPGLFPHPFTHVYFPRLFPLPSGNRSRALVLCTIH